MNVITARVWLYDKNINDTPTLGISVLINLIIGSFTPGPHTTAKLPTTESIIPK